VVTPLCVVVHFGVVEVFVWVVVAGVLFEVLIRLSKSSCLLLVILGELTVVGFGLAEVIGTFFIKSLTMTVAMANTTPTAPKVYTFLGQL
jgi:hypothetical protein